MITILTEDTYVCMFPLKNIMIYLKKTCDKLLDKGHTLYYPYLQKLEQRIADNQVVS